MNMPLHVPAALRAMADEEKLDGETQLMLVIVADSIRGKRPVTSDDWRELWLLVCKLDDGLELITEADK